MFPFCLICDSIKFGATVEDLTKAGVSGTVSAVAWGVVACAGSGVVGFGLVEAATVVGWVQAMEAKRLCWTSRILWKGLPRAPIRGPILRQRD